MNWLSEIVHAAVTIVSVAVGGYISWRISSAGLNLTISNATRTDEVRRRREALYERLEMQRATYQEFLAQCAKHQAHGGSHYDGIIKKLDRNREDAASAHADAVGIYARLVLAFGSKDFAGQASQVIEMISAVRGNPVLETSVTALFANKYAERMQQAIEATEKQLELPAHGLVPEPVIPPAEYNREFMRIKLRDIAQQHGLDPKRVDEIMTRVKQDGADPDESPPVT